MDAEFDSSDVVDIVTADADADADSLCVYINCNSNGNSLNDKSDCHQTVGLDWWEWKTIRNQMEKRELPQQKQKWKK